MGRYAKRLLSELQCLIERYHLNPDVIGINVVLVEYLCYNNLGSAGLLVPHIHWCSFLNKLAVLPNKTIRKTSSFITGNLMRARSLSFLVEDDRNSYCISDIESGTHCSWKNLTLL